MKKLVVLKLDGDLSQGVRVTLEIGEEDSRPATEITAQLPPASELVTVIDQWHSTYRSLGKSSRLEAKKIVYGGSIAQWQENCNKSAVDLRSRLNNWLLSESFRPIREKWLQQLSPSDEVRVLIRTSSMQLRKLPWHLWDLIEDYPNTEVAHSTPESEPRPLSKTPTYRDKVRILAILGNSTGINVQKDRELLENLPDATTTFLVEPQRQDINDQLWNQPWDILFFAGHSKTEGNTGRIFINQNDYLTIGELKYALSNAVKNGLQLAIFNSCDGLGLALDLQQLHIGQIIVMREPVPDQVAQAFLTYFLAAFAGGKSFYLAEREARLKLQGLENNFPCASWLPAIFQNPTVLPPMWQDLGRRPTEVCPYRGLFAFREEDAPFFKGREAFTQMLVEAVQQQSLVAIIGPSGSGKSSVVFAGLIPQLRLGAKDIMPLRIVSFRPGDHPFCNLAAKLVPLLETQMSETDQLLEINKLAKALRQGDLTLRDVVTRLLEKNSGDRLLLVADQFEELYTLCRDAQERLLFLDSLLEVSERIPNFTLVITLRADFLGQALSYRPFGDALQYADLKLSPMNREELQAAVEQPAMMLGVTIESGLIERILDAVNAEPGDLPLLEFALNQLWAKQRDAQLTHAAYEEIGGVEAALARYAEEAYGNLNEEEKERARRLFIQLVRPGEGTEDTRRLATRTEVGEENWDLVTRLADARLVVSSRDEAAGEETVEIVHEALIGGWERLRLWIELDRSFRIWQERLRASLRQWEASDRDEGALLRGALLAEGKGWLQSRPVELSSSECVFIQLSLELRHRERKEQERQRQQTIFGLAGGLVLVSILAVGTFWQWQQAEQRRTNAEINSLNERSQALFNSDNRSEALIASLTAAVKLKRTTWGVEADTRTQVMAKLQQAVYGVTKLKTLKGHNAPVINVSFSPDGKTIASASSDCTVKLWNPEGRELQTFKGDSTQVNSVSFSPDGKMIAAASDNGSVKLWNLEGRQLQTFKGHSTQLTSVSFSPDGKTIASTSVDGIIKLWNLDGKQLQTIKGHNTVVLSVSFSPDGKTIASTSVDGIIKLWSLDGKQLQTLEGISTQLSSISFSPDGKTIAAASADGTVKLWNLESRQLQTFKGHNAPVLGISFSPDGKTIASASADGTVKLWNLDGRQLQTLKDDNAGVTSVSFSPDGKMIAAASVDGIVKLWTLQGTELQTLKRHSSQVLGISFSPDGKTISTTSNDEPFKLWTLQGTELQILKKSLQKLDSSSNRKRISHSFLLKRSNGDQVNSVSFSPDGKMIATASNDGLVRLWNLEDKELQTLHTHGAQLISVSFSPDGKTIAGASVDGIVRLWNLEGRELQALNLKGHKTMVISASFSPDGKTIAFVSLDRTVQLWNLGGRELQTPKWSNKWVNSVSFSPDSKTIAVARLDGSVKLWNLEGRELQTLKGHNAQVRSVSFSPDGKTFASGSDDKTVKLWNLEGKELQSFKGHHAEVNSVSFSPDGKTIASASRDKTGILWNVDSEDLLVRGCDWLRDYVKNNPDVSESNKHLCDGIGTQKKEQLRLGSSPGSV